MNQDTIFGIFFALAGIMLIAILGKRVYRRYTQKKAREQMLALNRKAMRKVVLNPNTIFWIRIGLLDQDPFSVPVIGSENHPGSGLANLLTMVTMGGEMIIYEMPIEHDPNYGPNASWMKDRAFKLMKGEYPTWVEPFLPSKQVLNSLVPAGCREQGVTVWNPSPDEKTIEEVPTQSKVKQPDPVEQPRQGGSTLLLGSLPSTQTGTLFDKRTLALLPGTGSEVVQATKEAKPVLVPRSPNNKGGGSRSGEGTEP